MTSRHENHNMPKYAKTKWNKTVYTIPDDTEFLATSIAWKLPYFELKMYITKIRLPSQIGIKIQV